MVSSERGNLYTSIPRDIPYEPDSKGDGSISLDIEFTLSPQCSNGTYTKLVEMRTMLVITTAKVQKINVHVFADVSDMVPRNVRSK